MSFLSSIIGLLPAALEKGTSGLASTYLEERKELSKHKRNLALQALRQRRRGGGDSSIEATNRVGGDVNMGYGGFRPTGGGEPGGGPSGGPSGGPPGGGIGGRGAKRGGDSLMMRHLRGIWRKGWPLATYTTRQAAQIVEPPARVPRLRVVMRY